MACYASSRRSVFVVNLEELCHAATVRPGSLLDIMKISFPNGFSEPVIATVLRDTLRALEYFHQQGQIHRLVWCLHIWTAHALTILDV